MFLHHLLLLSLSLYTLEERYSVVLVFLDSLISFKKSSLNSINVTYMALLLLITWINILNFNSFKLCAYIFIRNTACDI